MAAYSYYEHCEHCPLYRIENEAQGGVGCPLCNLEQASAMTIAASHCPHCGRDYAADVFEYSPLQLCDHCGEEYDNALYIPFDGSYVATEDEFFSFAALGADCAGYPA